jgi:hypothetical protein
MRVERIVGFCGLCLLACTPATRVVRLSPTEYAPRSEDYPIRFYRESLPECPYEEIGMVVSRQRHILISMDAVAESLRDKARELGGDAVIRLSEQDQIQGAVISSRGVKLDRDPVLSGTVIRFTRADCRQ